MRAMAGAAGALLMMAPLRLVAQDHYSINSADSKVEIHVYKEGVFKAFGHDHVIAAKDISGDVQFEKEKIEESSVQL